jgi:hypothetical protein
MLDQHTLESIADKVNDQSERYRERWLTAKLSLYSSFLTFAGLAVAAAALFAQAPSEPSRRICSAVMFLSMISALFVFVQYHWLLRLYNALGFSKVRFQSERDIDEYRARQTQYYGEFDRRKRARRFMDTSLYIIALAQIVLLGIASNLL